MIEQDILNKYRKYDYLNKENEHPFVKILVSYIKHAFLFKSEILTPIHLGRSIAKEESKDGSVSNKDLKWLYTNCISDDNFEGNISYLNRRVGFFTGTYWAWKNYEKLGNPEYFGSFGYRRLLSPDFLPDLQNYDVILPHKRKLNLETIKEQCIHFHGNEIFNAMMDTFNMVYPNEIKFFEIYCQQTVGYFDEIYIMKKELFFNFCTWITPLFSTLIKLPSISSKEEKRDLAFIIERLTGFYLSKLSQNRTVKWKEAKILLTEKMIVNPKIINTEMFSKLRKTKK